MFATISKTLGLAIFSLMASLTIPAFGEDVTGKIEAPKDIYFQKLAEAKSEYRKALASLLAQSASAEIFLLDFDLINNGRKMAEGPFASSADHDRFPIRPYHETARILAQRALTPNEIKVLLTALQPVVGVRENKYGALCHHPIHGIRLWSEDRTLLFETSFCWHCHNFYVRYPTDDAGWVGMSSAALEKTMRELMPIPEKELKRFAEWGQPTKEPPKK